jgi:hypothetical protein
MTKILVNIWAYDHHAKFIVECEDNSASLEKAILDKLGEKSIVWEYLGISYDNKISRITYEEVINGEHDATSERPLHEEKGSGSRMGAGAS